MHGHIGGFCLRISRPSLWFWRHLRHVSCNSRLINKDVVGGGSAHIPLGKKTCQKRNFKHLSSLTSSLSPCQPFFATIQISSVISVLLVRSLCLRNRGGRRWWVITRTGRWSEAWGHVLPLYSPKLNSTWHLRRAMGWQGGKMHWEVISASPLLLFVQLGYFTLSDQPSRQIDMLLETEMFYVHCYSIM